MCIRDRNTGIGLPTDLWVPSTDKIAPQQSSQVAAGFAKDFEKQGLALTIEGYYKNMNNIVNYKAVSYTHLDVYKRQAYSGSSRSRVQVAVQR